MSILSRDTRKLRCIHVWLAVGDHDDSLRRFRRAKEETAARHDEQPKAEET